MGKPTYLCRCGHQHRLHASVSAACFGSKQTGGICPCTAYERPVLHDCLTQQQWLFLMEGCCPNRHGPLVRVGDNHAACTSCGLEWKSPRVAGVFPKEGANA